MEIGAAIFFTDYSMAPTDLAVAWSSAALNRCGWRNTRTCR
jgi:hypothetical protein